MTHSANWGLSGQVLEVLAGSPSARVTLGKSCNLSVSSSLGGNSGVESWCVESAGPSEELLPGALRTPGQEERALTVKRGACLQGDRRGLRVLGVSLCRGAGSLPALGWSLDLQGWTTTFRLLRELQAGRVELCRGSRLLGLWLYAVIYLTLHQGEGLQNKVSLRRRLVSG